MASSQPSAAPEEVEPFPIWSPHYNSQFPIEIHTYRTSAWLCQCYERDCPSCFAHYYCNHHETTCNNCEDATDENALREIEWKHYPASFSEFRMNLRRETSCIKAFESLENDWLAKNSPPQHKPEMVRCFEAVKRNVLIMGRQLRWLQALTASSGEYHTHKHSLRQAVVEYEEFHGMAVRFLKASTLSLPLDSEQD